MNDFSISEFRKFLRHHFKDGAATVDYTVVNDNQQIPTEILVDFKNELVKGVGFSDFTYREMKLIDVIARRVLSSA